MHRIANTLNLLAPRTGPELGTLVAAAVPAGLVANSWLQLVGLDRDHVVGFTQWQWHVITNSCILSPLMSINWWFCGCSGPTRIESVNGKLVQGDQVFAVW